MQGISRACRTPGKAEHDAMVTRLKRERIQFLNSFPGLDPSLVESLG